MKKPLKKLTLNKKTLSNLTAAEMSQPAGGEPSRGNCNTKRYQTCSHSLYFGCTYSCGAGTCA